MIRRLIRQSFRISLAGKPIALKRPALDCNANAKHFLKPAKRSSKFPVTNSNLDVGNNTIM